MCLCAVADKTQDADETTDGGAELTEEEWNLRVAELNKHQVRPCRRRHSKWDEGNWIPFKLESDAYAICFFFLTCCPEPLPSDGTTQHDALSDPVSKLMTYVHFIEKKPSLR